MQMKRNAVLVLIILLFLSGTTFAAISVESEAFSKEHVAAVEKLLAEREPTTRGERIPIANRAEVPYEQPKTLYEVIENLEKAEAQPFAFDVSEYPIMNLEQILYNTNTIPYQNRAWIGAVKVEAPKDLTVITDQFTGRYYLASDQFEGKHYHAAGFFIKDGEAQNMIWLRAFTSKGITKQVLSVGTFDSQSIFEADYLSITTQAFVYNPAIDGGVLLVFENPFKK